MVSHTQKILSIIFSIDNTFPYKQLLINSLKVHRNEGAYDFS